VLGDQALGLSPAQIEKAPEIVSKHLRLLGET
jgi:L-serine deaminase